MNKISLSVFLCLLGIGFFLYLPTQKAKAAGSAITLVGTVTALSVYRIDEGLGVICYVMPSARLGSSISCATR